MNRGGMQKALKKEDNTSLQKKRKNKPIISYCIILYPTLKMNHSLNLQTGPEILYKKIIDMQDQYQK